MRNGHQSLWCLDTWSPAASALWEDCGALLKTCDTFIALSVSSYPVVTSCFIFSREQMGEGPSCCYPAFPLLMDCFHSWTGNPINALSFELLVVRVIYHSYTKVATTLSFSFPSLFFFFSLYLHFIFLLHFFYYISYIEHYININIMLVIGAFPTGFPIALVHHLLYGSKTMDILFITSHNSYHTCAG